jgi:hypothetical protein
VGRTASYRPVRNRQQDGLTSHKTLQLSTIGENDATLFATDGANVVHLNLPGLSSIWTYAPSSQFDRTNIIAGLQGDSLSILDTGGVAPHTQTMLLLDNTGTPTSSGVTGNISGPLPDVNGWLGIDNNLPVAS